MLCHDKQPEGVHSVDTLLCFLWEADLVAESLDAALVEKAGWAGWAGVDNSAANRTLNEAHTDGLVEAVGIIRTGGSGGNKWRRTEKGFRKKKLDCTDFIEAIPRGVKFTRADMTRDTVSAALVRRADAVGRFKGFTVTPVHNAIKEAIKNGRIRRVGKERKEVYERL
ncbi:FAD-linked oxidase [Micractinium conductrix]|uniref:FAD-linked oxidase n=1 Tax=Micractinium conductrix TaxID=554055 RepID=A0A2P6V3H2_9CHLO|nr:FAD-linked oxidase [Micractinium conductrix]|eukprot:PSC68641.1 FAD-linked oxidase [Micractinium conductrix]